MTSRERYRIRTLDTNRPAATASLALVIVWLLMVGAAQEAQAQTFSVIHTFTGLQDGAGPHAGLTMDGAGNLYGTTDEVLVGGNGNVFELKRSGSNWILTPIYTFSGGADGAYPQSRVVFGPNGSLYGTTEGGGLGTGCHHCGTVFKLTPSICRIGSCPWTETVLYRFTGDADGGRPTGDLAFDSAGNIYGTTYEGGNFTQSCGYGCGTVFKLTPSQGGWRETVLYAFGATASDGYNPLSGVVLDPFGNLYGTTTYGGTSQFPAGTVFQLTASGVRWTEKVLYNFQGQSDGAYPVAGVILDASDNLYGTTWEGGTGAFGTVFELTPTHGSWMFTVLHSFTGFGGPYANLKMDGVGNLWGTTNQDGAFDNGSVFKLTPLGGGSWAYTDLYDFTGNSDGKDPYSSLVFDTGGNLYGTAYGGGTRRQGVVFEITPH